MKIIEVKLLTKIAGITIAILVTSIVAADLLTRWFGDTERSGWAQAVGAVLAIVVGFATSEAQARAQQRTRADEKQALVEAACLLLYEAFETVNERLDAALRESNDKVLSLQGDRTTEIILAVREFGTNNLPSVLLSDFIRMRSHFFAINARMTEIFLSEERAPPNRRGREERSTRLASAVRVRKSAKLLFDRFQSNAKQFGVVERTLAPRVVLDTYETQISIDRTF